MTNLRAAVEKCGLPEPELTERVEAIERLCSYCALPSDWFLKLEEVELALYSTVDFYHFFCPRTFDDWMGKPLRSYPREFEGGVGRYRFVDADYYLWLVSWFNAGGFRSRPAAAQRFKHLADLAMMVIGKEAIYQRAEIFEPANYKAPAAPKKQAAALTAFTYDLSIEQQHGCWFEYGVGKHLVPVAWRSILEIDRIRDEALQLGWSMDELYRNRSDQEPIVNGRWVTPGDKVYWCYAGDLSSAHYGLTAFFDEGDRIRTVTSDFIEIARSHTAINQRFLRPSSVGDHLHLLAYIHRVKPAEPVLTKKQAAAAKKKKAAAAKASKYTTREEGYDAT